MAGKKKDTSLLHHLIGSRSLVWNLAKNDIKKKFAGSYFGVVWAFVPAGNHGAFVLVRV